MLAKKWVLILMVLAAMAQVIIPAMMVLNSENVITDGIPNKIRTAPVEPNDPFIGKYIRLNFMDNSISIPPDEQWKRYDRAYVSFKNDNNGFAVISSVSKIPPKSNRNYIKTKILSAHTTDIGESETRLKVDFPFDRFYMKETKAPRAEKLYNQRRVQDSVEVYALLMVEGGDFILKDVIYDGQSISDVVGE